MKEFRYSTKAGKNLVDRANNCIATSLYQLYDSWSSAKQRAFDYCWEQYAKGVESTGFGIGNANTFGFTASWFEKVDGEDVCRIETKDNSYLVWLDR